ncbi:MAG: hypothetical protein KDD01_19705 [Phaeodactylibacter sp.]|nr:hypothetical protein [Phaeodactylibacter sp.]
MRQLFKLRLITPLCVFFLCAHANAQEHTIHFKNSGEEFPIITMDETSITFEVDATIILPDSTQRHVDKMTIGVLGSEQIGRFWAYYAPDLGPNAWNAGIAKMKKMRKDELPRGTVFKHTRPYLDAKNIPAGKFVVVKHAAEDSLMLNALQQLSKLSESTTRILDGLKQSIVKMDMASHGVIDTVEAWGGGVERVDYLKFGERAFFLATKGVGTEDVRLSRGFTFTGKYRVITEGKRIKVPFPVRKFRQKPCLFLVEKTETGIHISWLAGREWGQVQK